MTDWNQKDIEELVDKYHKAFQKLNEHQLVNVRRELGWRKTEKTFSEWFIPFLKTPIPQKLGWRIAKDTAFLALGSFSNGRGRPMSPDSMVKKGKAWSMTAEDWEWLESQVNQSETIRQAIALYSQSSAQ